MQGASPLASPGLDGARHGLNLRSRHPAGASPRRWRLDQPLRCLTGACLAGRLPTLPLVYFVSPYPPAPFPGGEGGDYKFISPGASPPAPRHLPAYGTYRPCRTGILRKGSCGSAQSRQKFFPQSSAGSQGEGGPGEMELSVANATAAFEMVLSPGAGIASAAGKKETKGFLMQGASPLASPGLDGTRHGHCLWKTGSFGFNGALAPAGAVGTRVVKSPPARAPVHRVCKCRRRFSAGVPGASPPAK